MQQVKRKAKEKQKIFLKLLIRDQKLSMESIMRSKCENEIVDN